MNLVAIDIGNTNISIGLFIEGEEQFIESVSGNDSAAIGSLLKNAWEKIPLSKRSKEKKHDGAIAVCSVKPQWTTVIKELAKKELSENILLIGKDIPYPIELSVNQTGTVGSDRLLAAAAAFAVIESAVVIADFGTAVTIDIVDERGIFLGGVICPGFEISAKALHENTAQLPKISVTKPTLPWGRNTEEAINCGLYYSAVGTLEEVVRRFAEKTGTWPQTVITGSGAALIKDDCQFVDSYVPNLVTKGVALAYQNYLDEME